MRDFKERTAIYLRKSRMDPDSESVDETLARHMDTLVKFANRLEMHITGIYKEVVSGDGLFTRPEMVRLLQDIGQDKYTSVLCMEIDRLGRSSQKDSGIIFETFKEREVYIVTPNKTYNLNDDIDEQSVEMQSFIARQELKSRFPIWFEMRQYESGNDRQLAFKVKIAMSEEQRQAEMRKAYDICFNILTSVGANIGTIGDIFARVEFEDLRPFMAKLMDLVSYVRENRHIKDVNRYLSSSMEIWFADWLERYERIDQDESQL